MPEWVVMDGPEDRCFGCGQRNELGLRMTFSRKDDGSVEAVYNVPPHYAGPPGVVHGGIQAALLDEVQGIAVHSEAGDEARIVTAEFNLRYRRPVASETALTIRGRVVRRDEPNQSQGAPSGRILNYFTEGEIVDESGEVLTRAEARWRRLD